MASRIILDPETLLALAGVMKNLTAEDVSPATASVKTA